MPGRRWSENNVATGRFSMIFFYSQPKIGLIEVHRNFTDKFTSKARRNGQFKLLIELNF